MRGTLNTLLNLTERSSRINSDIKTQTEYKITLYLLRLGILYTIHVAEQRIGTDCLQSKLQIENGKLTSAECSDVIAQYQLPGMVY